MNKRDLRWALRILKERLDIGDVVIELDTVQLKYLSIKARRTISRLCWKLGYIHSNKEIIREELCKLLDEYVDVLERRGISEDKVFTMAYDIVEDKNFTFDEMVKTEEGRKNLYKLSQILWAANDITHGKFFMKYGVNPSPYINGRAMSWKEIFGSDFEENF